MFHGQRAKLENISTTDIDYSELPVVPSKPTRDGRKSWSLRSQASQGGQVSEQRAYGEQENPNSIYMQEHLTQQTKKLLQQTRETLKELNFAYGGYVKDGEIRAKKEERDIPTVIRSQGDLDKLVNSVQVSQVENQSHGDQ